MVQMNDDEFYLLQKESEEQSLNLWLLNPKKDKLKCLLKLNSKKTGVSLS